MAVLCKRWDHQPEIDAGSIANTVNQFKVPFMLYGVRKYMADIYADSYLARLPYGRRLTRLIQIIMSV